MAKLVERLVRARVQYVVERWGLLHHEQAGFRAARSCEEQLVLVTQRIVDGFQRGWFSLMLQVDFSAAFDRAWRARLLQKLLDRGFLPATVRWFDAFLTDRTGRVRVGGVLSAAKEFEEGFPQGTVLGPLMWDIFVDDVVDALKQHLPASANVEVVLYADDVSVLLAGPDLEELCRQAQQVLDDLSKWEVAHKARVSLEKSTVTVFDGRHHSTRRAAPVRKPRLLFRDQGADPPGKQQVLK